ncbi:MAG TPA: hypothetical protein VI259_10910 [Gemmatimonadaceae bacterium]
MSTKEVIIRALKISGLPHILQGVTPGELANALVQRNTPMAPEEIEAAAVEALNFLRDAVASLDALVARFGAAKSGDS